MTLKGQNFRIYLFDGTGQDAHCSVIGMSTNCTITLTGNTDDASHKDIVGAAQLPTIVSKSWQVTVESLDVMDTGLMLKTFKGMQKVMIGWSSNQTSDNQTTITNGLTQSGYAYLSDCTFTFNDRENSVKNLQFSGCSELSSGPLPVSVNSVPNTFTKGQFVRLFLGDDNTASPVKVIGAAKNLSLHCSLQLEDATTKDTEGDWVVQEPTGYSYEISTSALVQTDETITSSVQAQDLASIISLYKTATPVKYYIANVGGANQRTKMSTIIEGSVIISNLALASPNRQNVTYDATLTGYGDFTLGNYIAWLGFDLPITQAQIDALPSNKKVVKFVLPTTASDLVANLKVAYQDGSTTKVATVSVYDTEAVTISVDSSDMLQLQATSDTSVWMLLAQESVGPTYTAFYWMPS